MNFKTLIRIFSSLFILIPLLSANVWATTYTVTKTADTNDGTCNEDCSLREAIVASNNHLGQDTIILPNGTFEQSITGAGEHHSATGDFNINDDLILIGKGADNSIILGSGNDRVFSIDTFSKNKTVTLSDLTIKGGNSTYGGGILNNAILSLTNVTLSNNIATNGGGIISSNFLTMDNCTLKENVANSTAKPVDGFGGAIFIATGSLSVSNSNFIGNLTDRNGGGIYTSQTATLNISNSYFEANDASGSGGAACVNYTTDISNSDFFNNQANDGGAISSYGTATLGISESTFRSNRTDGLDLGGGGALFNFLGIVEIKGSLFQGNTALGEGGGAIENTGELVISNSQFLNNQAIQHDASQLPDTTSPGFGGAILLIDGAVTTLTDTTLTENTAATSGGAIYNDQSSILTVAESTMDSNKAEMLYGGAIYNEGSLEINDSSLSKNQAGKLGGALGTRVGNVLINQSTLSENVSLISGGAIYNSLDSPPLIIKGSQIFKNSASQHGGAIMNESSLTLETTTIDENSAAQSGGGIYNDRSAQVTMDRSTLSNNSADVNGGGIWNTSNVTITRSTINNNHAIKSAGGIGNSSGILKIYFSQFFNNQAGDGGAIGNFGGSTSEIENSSFYENSASAYGGAIINSASEVRLKNSTLTRNSAHIGGSVSNNDSAAVITLSHTTIAKNSAVKTASELLNYQGRVTVLNSLVQGSCNNQGTIISQGGNYESPANTCSLTHALDTFNGSDPLLGSLSNNGGVTKTLALSSGSLAISNGNSSLCLAADQRGQTRVNCDSGGYEYGETATIDATMGYQLITDADMNGNINYGDTLEFLVTLRNIEDTDAANVIFEDTLDQYLDLDLGSVTTTQGSVSLGNTSGEGILRVEIGTVAAYDDVQIRYKVIIGTKETTTLYNQGIAFGSNTSQIQTDDADTAASDDSTQISVMRPDDAQVFIERFFENILGRSADSAGMAYWMGQMENTTAAYVALGFFNSNEFKDMNLDPHAFVRLLYNTMYGRQADDDGLAYWTNQLNNDVTREAVIFSFLNAAEFSQLSQRYNVKAISDGVEGFVMRFYALVLGRVDSGGLEYWSNQINKKYQTPQEVAIKFFSGQEYQDMNQNNPTFINTAYQAFFGRIADDAGKKHWGNIMESGTNRLEIIEQFIDSEEFQSLITSFGL